MKILMLISSLAIGGAETHVVELSAALVRRGEQVCVVSGGGVLSERLSALGVEHITLPLGSRDPFSLIRAYMGLRRILRHRRFDVIHAHSRLAAFIGERVARGSEACFVTTAHARFESSPLKNYMSEWGYYVSAVSEDIALHLRRVYGVAREQIWVIPNGIDTKKFCPPRKSEGRERRILFASRLDADCSRGAYVLLRAALTLAKKYRGLSISVAGGGSEYKRLSALAREVNCALGYECVRMLGARGDIDRVMRQHGIFVGVSRAALEAMACGACVVLAGNEGVLGALDEKVLTAAEKSNFCARGYGDGGEREMISEIERFMDMSESERRRISDVMRGYVVAHHSIERSAAETARFYRAALQRCCLGRGDVCLCGYYGHGNMGDDTLLSGAIRRAREEYGDGICALTHRPRRDTYRFGVRCVRAENPFAVLREIRRARCLVFGGGTLLQDRTSLRSLLYYSAIARAAQRRGIRVELWGNGLGPIDSRLGRRVAGRVLRGCDHLGFRDSRSLSFALSLGASRARTVLERDIAFYLEGANGENEIECTDGKYAVFAVSGRGSARELDRVRREAYTVCREEIRPIFVGMYPSEDRRISRRMSGELGGEYLEGLCAEELISLLRSAKVCVSMRLHLLIFSSIAGTTFVGVGSDPKIRAFCEENGGIYKES